MRTFKGIAASPGYAVGPVYPVRRKSIVPVRRSLELADLAAESDRFRGAVDLARAELEVLIERLTTELGPEEADILTSQLLILEDEMVWDATLAAIRHEKINAEAAFARTVGEVATRFLEIEDETFRERVNDLRDVEQRVLRAFMGRTSDQLSSPEVPSIISAVNLSPSDTASLGQHNVLGFIMDEGGNTSHVAILARSIGVPAIVGLRGAAVARPEGQTVAIDGTDGRCVVEPDAETTEQFNLLTRQQIVVNEKLVGLKDLPAITPDGHQVRMMANIELPVEVDEALARGAEGIGLLRTEFLFFQHQTIPTEDDQVQMYTEMVRRMGDRPVIFRTLDVGGDKVSDYLGAKREYNPFLGWRGIRFSLANRQLFKNQMKAICRAATVGNAKIMFPMITGVQELRQAREVLAEGLAELKRDGVPHRDDLEVGIMIETPSAVLAADLLAAESDFLSIGSNDLIQYTLAMDRGNSRVSYLYQPLHPAILRSIRLTVEAGHKAGIWVGLCGEMGSETRLAEVLLGLGLDEISLHGAALPKIKQVIRWTSFTEAKAVVDALIDLPTADDANRWLADYIADRKRQRDVEGD
ncbi:MAG: phosphoenolpyruvate--protein phosphotransferase [Candidatus Krumholzibacteria bacterium]|nr:phosphoenolpyruvate--protein phosphotransferase [Candidatus Krumholzibacteria bacterium]